MNKPTNINDYSQCVKVMKDGIVKIFCVECNEWHSVSVIARCNVEFSQHLRPCILDNDDNTYICAGCKADVGYLLDSQEIIMVMENLK